MFPSLQEELEPDPEQLDKQSARSGTQAMPARREWSPCPSCPWYLLGLSLPPNSSCQLCPLLLLENKWDALQGATLAQGIPSHGVPALVRVSSAAPFQSCLQSSTISLRTYLKLQQLLVPLCLGRSLCQALPEKMVETLHPFCLHVCSSV